MERLGVQRTGSFMDGEKILRLPAKQKKRKVILKWLTVQVPPEIRIPHSEFNSLLQRHHPDSATCIEIETIMGEMQLHLSPPCNLLR